MLKKINKNKKLIKILTIIAILFILISIKINANNTKEDNLNINNQTINNINNIKSDKNEVIYKVNELNLYETNKIFNYYYNENFEECYNYCYEIIKKDPGNSAAYIFYFASAYQLDKLQETINSIDQEYYDYTKELVSQNKQFLENDKKYQYLSLLNAYSNLFLYYTSKEKSKMSYLEEALNNFRNSLFFPVSYSSIYTGLGVVYFEKSLNERAISNLNKALSITPNDPIALEYYAKLQNNLQNYQLTISKLEKFKNLIKYPDLIFLLGYAYEMSNEIDKAINTYNLVYNLDPKLIGNGYIALLRLGDIYLNNKKDKEKAIQTYNLILQVIPDSIVAKTKIEEAQKTNLTQQNNNSNTKTQKKSKK
ncbi:MAG: tetratricopeptide repeat protein [bacterium]|jgi:tetratricopeptide (TPR) repeat protein